MSVITPHLDVGPHPVSPCGLVQSYNDTIPLQHRAIISTDEIRCKKYEDLGDVDKNAIDSTGLNCHAISLNDSKGVSIDRESYRRKTP